MWDLKLLDPIYNFTPHEVVIVGWLKTIKYKKAILSFSQFDHQARRRNAEILWDDSIASGNWPGDIFQKHVSVSVYYVFNATRPLVYCITCPLSTRSSGMTRVGKLWLAQFLTLRWVVIQMMMLMIIRCWYDDSDILSWWPCQMSMIYNII